MRPPDLLFPPTPILQQLESSNNSNDFLRWWTPPFLNRDDFDQNYRKRSQIDHIYTCSGHLDDQSTSSPPILENWRSWKQTDSSSCNMLLWVNVELQQVISSTPRALSGSPSSLKLIWPHYVGSACPGVKLRTTIKIPQQAILEFSCWPFDKHITHLFFAHSSLFTCSVAQILSAEHWIPARKPAPNFGCLAIWRDASCPQRRIGNLCRQWPRWSHTLLAGHPPSHPCLTFCPFCLFLLYRFNS